MRSPVRGGLKGGRRSVKRGQSVEFADYRDYSLGDDLRQLDWNVYARLEKLFVKLFVEEEDVTVTLLLDASASMASGPPAEAAVREARRGGARLHRPGQRGPRRGQRPVRADRRAGGPPCAAPGASSGSWPTCPRSSRPTARPTSSPRPATPPRSSTAAGVVVLLSRPARSGRRPGHPRARGDRLGAHRPARPVARRARPAARGRPAAGRQRDRRPGRHHGRPRHDRRLQGPPRRLEGDLRRPRGQAPGELRRPGQRREPGRPDVRRAAPAPGPGLRPR